MALPRAFPRSAIIALALSTDIAPSPFFSRSLSSMSRNVRSPIFVALPFAKRSFSSLLPQFPFSSPLLTLSRSPTLLPYHYLSVYGPLRSSHVGLSLSPACSPLRPAVSTAALFSSSTLSSTSLAFPLHHLPRAILPPSTRASRRRLAKIFSLLPSRNEQCGGSGMQDGRCVLEPHATRTLLQVNGNEKDIARRRRI